MNWSLCITLAVLLQVHGTTGEAVSETVLARETITKWVEARQLLAETRAAWEADREVLTQSINLHETALANLKEQLAETGTASEQIGRERDQLLAEQRSLEKANEAVAAQLAPLEARIRGLTRAFPAPLLSKLEPLLARLPEDPANTQFSIPARVQTVVGILGEVEKFNGSISVHSEIQQTQAGQDVQVRTLYVGLAQAYWVDQAGRAGIGVPGPAGWEWTPAPGLAETVTRAIAIYENSQPAAFVSLPVSLK